MELTDNIKLLGIVVISIISVVAVALFRIQMDDERYYMMYDFDNVQDDVYDARGILHTDDAIMSQGDIIGNLPAIHLEAGEYTFQVNHQQDTDSIIRVLDGDALITEYILPSSDLDTNFSFAANKDLYHLVIQFIYNGGTVDIKHVYIRSKGLLYSDTFAGSIIIIVSILVYAFFLCYKNILSMGNKERIYLLLFPAFFCFVNYLYFREYWLPGSGGDFSFWVGRIEQTKNELLRGQIPVQIYGDALEGHGVLGTLYPSLFVYIPALFRMMRISMEMSLRLFFILINLGTMYTSHYTLKHITNNRLISFVGMVVYTTLPYRLGCMCFRCAYGEALSMIFIPLVILGIYEIFIGEKKRWLPLTIGLSGILQSHVLSMLMITAFCVLIGLFLLRQLFRKGRIVSLIKAIVAFLLLNLWYIVPFVECYGYDLRLEQSFAIEKFFDRTYYPSQFFTIITSIFSVNERDRVPMLGPALWILCALAIYYIIFGGREKDLRAKFASSLVLMGLLFVFMQSRLFPWETLQKFDIIKKVGQMMQFPMRNGQIGQSCIAIGGTIILSGCELYMRNIKKIASVCAISACVLMLFITDSWIMQFLSTEGEMKLIPDIETLDYEDYAMREYNGDMYPNEPVSDATILNYMKIGTRAEFDYIAEENTYVDVPIQAYPGYEAHDANGRVLICNVGQYSMLRISIPATQGGSHVYIEYSQPRPWRVAGFISIITFIVLVLIELFRRQVIKYVKSEQ